MDKTSERVIKKCEFESSEPKEPVALQKVFPPPFSAAASSSSLNKLSVTNGGFPLSELQARLR